MFNERFKNDGRAVVQLSPLQMQSKRNFESEVKNPLGMYQFEDYLCECGADASYFETLAEKDRYGFEVKTVICRKCGLMMTNPRMTQKSYDTFYDLEYGKLYRDQEQVVIDENYFEAKVSLGKDIYDFCTQYGGTEISEVLEIGCAAGGILQYFKNMGCNITGCDLGSTYINWGREKGLNLLNCHSSELIASGKKFDLIIINHVFEHFLDIEKELEVIKQLLSDRGILYIAVPGIKAIGEVYDSDFLLFLQNAHVRHFTLRTLEAVLDRYGFSLHAGTEEVRAIFKYTGEVREQQNSFYVEIMKTLYEFEFEKENQ